jgi:hypothetical protein
MDAKQRNRSIELFNKEIKQQYSMKASSATVLQADKKDRIINYLKCEDEIKSMRIEQKKSNKNQKKAIQKKIIEAIVERESYNGNTKWKKRYSLTRANGEDTLVVDSKYLVGTIEDAYENLEAIHIASLHAKAQKFYKQVKEVYGSSYTQELTRVFVTFCPICSKDQKFPTTRAGANPIVHTGPWRSVQIDLIDFTKMPDKIYKYVLTLKDHFSRFAALRPLTTKTHNEVARQLVDIFSLLGVPNQIHCDNGGEFLNVANKINEKEVSYLK